MPDAEALEGIVDPMTALMLPGADVMLAGGVALPCEGMAGCAGFEGSISASIGATPGGCAGTRELLSAGMGLGGMGCMFVAGPASAGDRAGAPPAEA